MRPFEIQTLSDNGRGLRSYQRLGDPITIITGSVALLQSIFPGLFGTNRKRLTDADWNQIFPGNGYWTVLVKNYLKQKIHYDVDLKYMYPHANSGEGELGAFVRRNRAGICPEIPESCFANGTTVCQACMTKFAEILQKEQFGGGSQYPPVVAGFDLTTLALIGGGILLVTLISKKGRRRKK